MFEEDRHWNGKGDLKRNFLFQILTDLQSSSLILFILAELIILHGWKCEFSDTPLRHILPFATKSQNVSIFIINRRLIVAHEAILKMAVHGSPSLWKGKASPFFDFGL